MTPQKFILKLGLFFLLVSLFWYAGFGPYLSMLFAVLIIWFVPGFFRSKTRRPWIRYNFDKEVINYIPIQGTVYIVRSGNLHKIGMTTRPVNSRIKELQSGNPNQVILVHTIPCYDYSASQVESSLHRRFRAKRKRGEYFALGKRDINWLKTIASA